MRRIFLPSFLLLLVACSGSSTTKPATVASVSLNETTATLVPQQSVTLVATTLDASGNALSGRAVTWIASAPTVAAVDNNGTVAAVTSWTLAQ